MGLSLGAEVDPASPQGMPTYSVRVISISAGGLAANCGLLVGDSVKRVGDTVLSDVNMALGLMKSWPVGVQMQLSIERPLAPPDM